MNIMNNEQNRDCSDGFLSCHFSFNQLPKQVQWFIITLPNKQSKTDLLAPI